MTGLVFEVEPPLILPVPNRADVSCFIGLVARRDTDLPEALHRWLIAQGWLQSPADNPGQARLDLEDLPVPLESWEMFDRLFAWDRRPSQLTDTPATLQAGQDAPPDATPFTTSSSSTPAKVIFSLLSALGKSRTVDPHSVFADTAVFSMRIQIEL